MGASNGSILTEPDCTLNSILIGSVKCPIGSVKCPVTL